MNFKKLFWDCLTENDGVSVCPIRVFGAILLIPSMLIFHGAALWMLIKHDTLDLQMFALTLVTMTGAVTTVFSVAIAIKAVTDIPLPPGH